MLIRHHAARRKTLTSSLSVASRRLHGKHNVRPEVNDIRLHQHATRIVQPAYRHDPSRRYASVAEKQPNIAVLGGGITGLASAYFLTQEFPNAKIFLFESKQELGGWVKSEMMDVEDGQVIFESGPRSLRPQPPGGTLTLKMIQDLGMIDDLLVTTKSSSAAQNRFIYYPDHLVRMPGPGQRPLDMLKTIWSEPAFKGIFRGILNDVRSDKRPDYLKDESVGDFIARRGSKHLADNLASALFHGIYAGDIYQLSARSILSIPWMREAKHGNLADAMLQAMTQKTSWNFCDDIALQRKLQTTQWEPRLREQVGNMSVFTFKKGLGELSKQLERRLSYKSNVKLMKATKITKLEKEEESSNIKLTYEPATSSSADRRELTPKTFSHVISTIPPATTFSLFPESLQSARPSTSLQRPLSTTMNATPAVTVLVVNLYYRTPHLLQTLTPPGGLPPSVNALQGFGYLMPRSLPFHENPERALGVIFDSDISPDLHTTVAPDKLGTRLTVMLGGHWWDGWTSFPDQQEAEEMAMNVLARHLGITEAPVAVRATLQKDCIPQYTVGHVERMAEAHAGLLDAFGGKLRVAGSWYHGVGVNDCLRSAFEVVQGLSQEVNEGVLGKNERGEREARTGLEKFDWGRPLALVKRERGEIEVVEVEEAAAKQGYFEGVAIEKKN